MTDNKKLVKTALFTDIHWGRKANSESHNNDCYNFVKWFCEQVKADSSIDNVVFMGDWFENRSAINVATINAAHRGARLLSDLGLPIYFIVGNHDCYYRHSRLVHSLDLYKDLPNFKVIEHPTVATELGNGTLLCPYLFHDEYNELLSELDPCPTVWMGHFEFKGFVVSGHNMRMPTGPDPNDYKQPDMIFSGHFHKRQVHKNICYIGSAFPLDFSDANDGARGMAVYDHESKTVAFNDWGNCPKYVSIKLSNLLDKSFRASQLVSHSRVKCLVDIPITFEESTFLKDRFTKEFKLRAFILEESPELHQSLTETDSGIDWEDAKSMSVYELVLTMLEGIDSKHIDNERLIGVYKSLSKGASE